MTCGLRGTLSKERVPGFLFSCEQKTGYGERESLLKHIPPEMPGSGALTSLGNSGVSSVSPVTGKVTVSLDLPFLVGEGVDTGRG